MLTETSHATDKCAEILGKFCKTSVPRRPLSTGSTSPRERERSSWTLKANVTGMLSHAARRLCQPSCLSLTSLS